MMRLRHVPTLIFTLLFALVLMAGTLLPPPATLEPGPLLVVFALYLGCAFLIKIEKTADFYRFVTWVFFFGVLLNLGWELWHSIYFTHFTEPGYTYLELVAMLWGSTIGDGVIILGLLFTLTLVRGGDWHWRRSTPWPYALLVILLATAVQIAIEIGATISGIWAYNAQMPIIPFLNVGLTPTLQMPVLALPSLWLAERMVCRSCL